MKRIVIAAIAFSMAAPLSSVMAASLGSSPFGKAKAEEEKAARDLDRARLNALAAWARLPANLQQAITSQLAPLNEQQRLALLNNIPALRNLTAEQMQLLLAQIAQVIPTPNAPPVASFAINLNSEVFLGYSNSMPVWQILVDASASSDTDGQVVKYQWDLSDGRQYISSSPTVNLQFYGAVGRTPTDYTLTLTVIDDKGASNSTAQTYSAPGGAACKLDSCNSYPVSF